MKQKILNAFLLVLLTVAISSCYSTRKSGCPGNPTYTAKFRG